MDTVTPLSTAASSAGTARRCDSPVHLSVKPQAARKDECGERREEQSAAAAAALDPRGRTETKLLCSDLIPNTAEQRELQAVCSPVSDSELTDVFKERDMKTNAGSPV